VKELHEIIVEPHITESASKQMIDPRTGIRQYVFKVAKDATKSEIKSAIESRFNVKVTAVNTLINRGKIKRVRTVAGKKSNWKKAYIKLQAGQKIAEFEGV
jgi:large subunit ribosomal protein L23